MRRNWEHRNDSEAVYDAALDPSRWPGALQAIADALGDVGAILLWRRDDGTFGSIASPKVLEAIDPEASDPADPAVVRDVLGLTLGEARMAALIGSGVAVGEASKKLGITEETARSVLKHVFSKTGVSRQSELVALLSRMVLR